MYIQYIWLWPLTISLPTQFGIEVEHNGELSWVSILSELQLQLESGRSNFNFFEEHSSALVSSGRCGDGLKSSVVSALFVDDPAPPTLELVALTFECELWCRFLCLSRILV